MTERVALKPRSTPLQAEPEIPARRNLLRRFHEPSTPQEAEEVIQNNLQGNRVTFSEARKAASTTPTFSSGCTLLDLGLGGGWAVGRMVNIVGDTSAGKCVRDAFIISRERGLQYIDEVGMDRPYGVSPFGQILALDRGHPCYASHFYREKVSRTLRYVTEHGFELTGTVDHKVKVLQPDLTTEERRLADLKPGDHVVVAPTTGLFPEHPPQINFKSNSKVRAYADFVPPETLTVRWAEFLGFFTADGTFSSGPLTISCLKMWKRRCVHELCESLVPGCFRMEPTGFVFSAKVREFLEYLHEKTLDGCTARYKSVPSYILRSPREIQASFLRGLLSCDSEVTGRGFSFTSASRRLAREVQMLLLNLGVVGTYAESSTQLEGWDESRPYYHVSVYGRRFRRFLQEVGFCFPVNKISSSGDTTSSYLSIPYAREALSRAVTEARGRLGWARNGKLRDGTRFPKLGLMSKYRSTISRDYFLDCLDLVGDFLDESFVSCTLDLLATEWIFERVDMIEEIAGEQDVYDVHVPEGHLFWCSGFISHNTLVAIEAFANHSLQFKGKNLRRYNEAENALNRDYAYSVGLPPDTVFTGDDEEREVDRRGSRTVEDFAKDLDGFLKLKRARATPCLYALDSCDALAVRAELDPKHNLGDSTRLAGKAALLSEFFRSYIADMDAQHCTLMIISQIRDNIGVMFGESKVRTGGKALDFYASQIVWLSSPKAIKVKVDGKEYAVGARTTFNVKKNKIAAPFARAQISIYFKYGIDDEISNIDWLSDHKLGAAGRLTIPLSEYPDAIAEVRSAHDFGTLQEMRAELQRAVRTRWAEVEDKLAPPMSKYGHE